MKVELVEVAPGRYRVKRDTPQNFARSEHPVPYVISDSMEPVEQVDGKFYTSKRQYRAVGRALGLVEVGNEKLKSKPKNAGSRAATEARRAAIRTALTRAGRP